MPIKSLFKLLWVWFKRLFTLPLIILILFEEWGWRPLSRALAWLSQQLGWLHAIEQAIRRAPRYVALALFLVPELLLLPVKLGILWIIHQGQTKWGMVLLITVKVMSTMLLGRIFVLTEPQLRQFKWLDTALNWWHKTKQRWLQAIKQTRLWRGSQRLAQRIKTWLHKL